MPVGEGGGGGGGGGEVIFLPKFHPELNFIERYWGKVKKHLRWHCDDSWHSLRDNVDYALHSDEVCNLTLMRKYSRIGWRYVDAYSKGMGVDLATYAVKKFRSHRMVSETMDERLYEAYLSALEKARALDTDGGRVEEGEEEGADEGLARRVPKRVLKN